MERITQHPSWERQRRDVAQIRGHLRDLWKGLNCSSTDFADGADNTTSFLGTTEKRCCADPRSSARSVERLELLFHGFRGCSGSGNNLPGNKREEVLCRSAVICEICGKA
jgi:hypothetical protein